MKQVGDPGSVSIVLTGSGGAGVMTAGAMLLDAAAAAGLYGLMTRSTGPQIRGGEAAAMLRLAPRPIDGPDDRFDLLVALDWENVQRFAAELPLDGDSLIVAEAAAGKPPEAIAAKGARFAELPLAQLAKKIPGGRANMVALGVIGALVGLPEAALLAGVEKIVGRKHAEARDASIAALRAGAEAAGALALGTKRLSLPAQKDRDRWAISGNHAAGLGALRGGVRFVAAYPITPATEILEWMAPALQKSGGVLVQAEDELASINMILGASYGGTPALTATSGPGLSLMIESLGLAVASEVPVVVVDVMRGGPSTGIPTKSEQTDLDIAVSGLHGEAPHVVVAPLSVGDCLFTTQWAVHLAEAMQVPALVLSDQALGQARAIIPRPADIAFMAQREVARSVEGPYQRYAVTPSGVSPMTLPGTKGGQYTADGLEHNPKGTPSSQAQDHLAQLEKRARKLQLFDYGTHWAEIDGAGDEPVAVVTWGSSTGPVREAVARARRDGVKARLVAIRLLAPAQPEKLAAALAGVERVIVVEQSHSAQFHRYLRAWYDLPGKVTPLHRPGPLPFRPGELHQQLLEVSR
jgi:2-oxoglutarate ferredoxin oxidoreductase subunit alpha